MEGEPGVSFDLSRRNVFAGGGLAALAGLVGINAAVASTASGGDDALLAEFDAVLQKTGEAAKLAFARSTARRPLDRATGLLHILNNLALGLAFHIHDGDPQHPELFRYMGPDRKQGGDNQDALYLGFAVDAAHTYRLYGNRGSAKYLSITTVEHGPTPWGGAMGAALYGRDLKTDANGDFEIILSATPHAGNWIKLSPRDFRITIRQFFADWENERPMRARVELVGEAPPPPVMSAERIMSGLRATGEWIESTILFWQQAMDMFRRTPNQFVSWRKLTGDKVNATPGGDPACAYWNVPAGQALIMRTRPPQCEFWNIEFNNPWWETMDYRNRLSGTNMHHAVLEEDGELIVVIAHEDPGVPNWLDTSGFVEGMVGRRWIFADSLPEIECRLVPHSALLDHLPKGVKRMTPAERRTQMSALRNGIYNRFNWM
ncbi:Protein of unknown function [Sphingomonas laterariae]|uniref:DUF1214 domain-containing protein n=1 Tax=Edaphosphingomonas laterariae TaxID=861865 RepID=A0A239BE59_9SPHN|nr:DUF1214 domain-containing protein [Sphingomonas laterariae]SNS06307.1 Protein of unknown function [Sphingomonas laterariae]